MPSSLRSSIPVSRLQPKDPDKCFFHLTPSAEWFFRNGQNSHIKGCKTYQKSGAFKGTNTSSRIQCKDGCCFWSGEVGHGTSRRESTLNFSCHALCVLQADKGRVYTTATGMNRVWQGMYIWTAATPVTRGRKEYDWAAISKR